MVTQVEIAKRAGVDVSTVNKILNGAVGPVFNQDTIARVRKIAKSMGYNFDRVNKHSLLRENAALKQRIHELTAQMAAQAGKLGAAGAAGIVLLVLRGMYFGF